MKKILFSATVRVEGANPNGDFDNLNKPKRYRDGIGYWSDVCSKRKLRNRMQADGLDILAKSDDMEDDGYKCLLDRVKTVKELEKEKDPRKFAKIACEKWADVRLFGQVFAMKSGFGLKSCGVKGAVTFKDAKSISPVEICEDTITKSYSDTATDVKGRDTVGNKSKVKFGLYRIDGGIDPLAAEKNGVTEADIEELKKTLCEMFIGDASAARPEDSMEVLNLYWWEVDFSDGVPAVKSREVFDSLKIEKVTTDEKYAHSLADYNIRVEEIPGVKLSVYSGK